MGYRNTDVHPPRNSPCPFWIFPASLLFFSDDEIRFDEHRARVHPIKVERRFPLDLRQSDTAIRQLYETSKQSRWDPGAFPWKDFDPGKFDQRDLLAARRVWSRRAWVESGGLAETPALLIRFCLELDREADPKYFLSVRNTEEAWHLECFHRFAEACGGYLERPANPAWEPLFNRRLYRDALHADMSIDAYVITHCAFVDGLEYELTRAWLAGTGEPLARSMLERCLADRERHAKFGWLYAERRAAGLSEQQRRRGVSGIGSRAHRDRRICRLQLRRPEYPIRHHLRAG